MQPTVVVLTCIVGRPRMEPHIPTTIPVHSAISVSNAAAMCVHRRAEAFYFCFRLRDFFKNVLQILGAIPHARASLFKSLPNCFSQSGKPTSIMNLSASCGVMGLSRLCIQ